MQISDYTGASLHYAAIELPKPSPQDNAADEKAPNSAGALQTPAAPADTTQNATPTQFSVSMLLDLLNSKGNDLQTPGPVLQPNGQFGIMSFSSCTVSNAGVPGGLQVGGLNASVAASKVIDAIGSNGKLSLSDVDKVLGVTGPATNYMSGGAVSGLQMSVGEVTGLEWARLAGGTGGTMTTAQLTTAIQSYLNTQSAMPQKPDPPLAPVGPGFRPPSLT